MDRGVFSEDEIKAIVARRRESEYLVRRRTTRKADFLRYLDQEMQLEKLRQLRTKRKIVKSHDVGDRHIVQHVHFLFSRLLRKFRSDVSLYVQYIEFCKSTGSLQTLGRIYAQALQVHPRNVGLWTEAASHEFFFQGSVGSARVLMQRALRVNPHSQQLWLQYFALELHHIQKLKGRREILRLTEHDDDDDNDDSLAIPTVVYNNAIQAIHDSVVFRLQFLDQCRMFPSTESVEEHIVETIARDFENDVQAWIARAAYSSDKNNVETAAGFVVDEHEREERVAKRLKTETAVGKPVWKVLEEAIVALPTAEMYVKSIQFLRSYGMEQQDHTAEECTNFVRKLLKEAEENKIASSELVLEEADVLLQEGKLSEAIHVLQAFATLTPNMEAPSVWLSWAKLCAESDKSDSSASRILRMALDRTPLHSKEQMIILLELFGALLMEASSDDTDEHDYKSELAQLFERMLLLSAGTVAAPSNNEEAVFGIGSVAAACLQYFRFSLLVGGIEDARRVYEQVLYRSNYGTNGEKMDVELELIEEFIDECIQLEKKETRKKKQRLSRLYDAAIKLFDSSNPGLADSYRSQRDSDVRYS